MRKFIASLILALSAGASAQQIITIPAVPSQTFTVDTCTYVPATGILTVNGVQVNVLSLTSLSLTGGTAYPPGLYVASIATGGELSWVPLTTTTGKTFTVSLPSTNGTTWALVPGATVSAGQQATVTAVGNHAGMPVTSDWFYYSQPRIYVDSTGAVYVGLSNVTATPITNAKVTVTVK